MTATEYAYICIKHKRNGGDKGLITVSFHSVKSIPWTAAWETLGGEDTTLLHRGDSCAISSKSLCTWAQPPEDLYSAIRRQTEKGCSCRWLVGIGGQAMVILIVSCGAYRMSGRYMRVVRGAHAGIWSGRVGWWAGRWMGPVGWEERPRANELPVQ